MKVLIVDDELPIREWMRFTLQGLGKELEILTAGNGYEAWELYQKEKPELVVTDIKMPRMDGLEFLQKIKSSEKSAYVVMLTSYGEFEYAREAIRHQANEYVLKNEITAEALSQILDNFNKSMEKAGKGERKKYLKTLIEQGSTEEYEKREENTSVFAVAFCEPEQEQAFPDLFQSSFIERMELLFYEPGISVLACSCRNFSSAASGFQEVMSLCQRLSGLREESVGFSGFCQTMLEACTRARKAWNLGFYEKRRRVFSWRDEEQEIYKEIQAQKRQAVAYLGQGRAADGRMAVQEFMRQIEKSKPMELDEIFSCIQDFIDACKIANLEFAGHELEELCEKAKKELRQAESLEELEILLRNFFDELQGAVPVSEKQYSKYVKSALAYVADHYASIESLSEISAHVNLNTEYFCRIFKAEVGTTFNSYLTEYRVRKAAELLQRTDLKVYEVAERVGYPNLSYFSRVFKKVTGENPFSSKK